MSDNLIYGTNQEDGYIYFPSEIGETSRGCKISRAALRKLENEPEVELDFVHVFERHKDTVLEIARKMIKAGNKNPQIERTDIHV